MVSAHRDFEVSLRRSPDIAAEGEGVEAAVGTLVEKAEDMCTVAKWVYDELDRYNHVMSQVWMSCFFVWLCNSCFSFKFLIAFDSVADVSSSYKNQSLHVFDVPSLDASGKAMTRLHKRGCDDSPHASARHPP